MLPFYFGILPSETAEEALRKDKHVKDEQVAAQVITDKPAASFDRHPVRKKIT